MKARLNLLPYFLFLTTLLAVACSERDPVSAVPNDRAEAFLVNPDEGITASAVRFTGRDSFGVALKANVSGTRHVSTSGPCPEKTVTFTGSGNATHLGRITVSQTHCTTASDPMTLTNGTFTLEGTTGASLSGTYESTAGDAGDASSFEALAQVTGGAVPFREEPAEGRGWMRGTISETHFAYEIDGWLLHHVRK